MLLALLIGGITTAETISVPQDKSEISAAIFEAQDGDTILISPGHYIENIVIENKRISLLSYFVFDQSFETMSQTIIDGSSPIDPEQASAITVIGEQSEGVVISGLTIFGGVGTFMGNRYAGGGVLIDNQASPVIKYNIITTNTATCGGGIAVYNSSPIIEKNLIIGNMSANGGGIDLEAASAFISDNMIVSNSASATGGAVRAIGSPGSVFTDNIILWNQGEDVGGIFCDDPNTLIQYNSFWDNSGGDIGDTGSAIGDTTCCFNFNGIPCDSFFNIFRDPMVSDLDGFNYTVLCSSSVIDAGSGTNPDPEYGSSHTDIGPLETLYLVGDYTNDDIIDIDDVVRLIEYVYLNGPAPCPLNAGDWNCDGKTNLIDISRFVNYIFKGGPEQCSN